MSSSFDLQVSARETAVVTATAGQTAIAITFPFQSVAELVIHKEAVDGTRTVLTAPSGFTATGAGSSAGGTATLVTPAAAGEKYRVAGAATIERRSDMTVAGRYNTVALEGDLDKGVIIDAELRRDLGRTVRAHPMDPALAPLPAKTARLGKRAVFDGVSGDLLAADEYAAATAVVTGLMSAADKAKLDAIAGAWQPQTISLGAFGATADGVSLPTPAGSDNAAAFEAAIAAVVAQGGGALTVPPGGNYRVAADIVLGNGSENVLSTHPAIRLEGLGPVGGFGANNPLGGGAIILDGAQIKVPGPAAGGALKNLFIVTPANYPAGRWAVDLFEVSYGQFDNLNFSLYGGNGMRFTGYGDNGNLFNTVGTVLFRMDTGVGAAGSKALELTQTGTIVDTASSTFEFIGVLPGRADQVAVTLGNCDTNSLGYLEVYPIPTPASTAVGATTNAAGYAAGVSAVTLAGAGTGTLVTGDCFQFANHATIYRLTSGDADVSNGGMISFAPALTSALPTSAQAITVLKSAVALRLDYTADADYPQSNTIDHFDCFNNRVESIGTPSQLAKNNPNVISYLNQQGGTPIPTGVSGLVVNRRRMKEGVLYVNASTGHDTLAAGMVPEGALKTIQRAYDLAALYYDLEGDLTIKLADGTHSVGLLANIRALGKKVTIQGNSASPGSVVLNVAGDAIVADGCHIVVRDILITGSGHSLRAANGGRIEYANIVFGSTVGAHAYADDGLIEQIGASFIIGGAAQHIRAANGGRVKSAFATTMLANVTFTDFARSETSGLIDCASATYPLNGNTVTGRRFNALDGDPVGAPSADFPGTVAGYANRRVRVLAQSAVQVASTAVTTEEVLATISIPAGALGLNGRLRIQAEGAMTNNANNKTLRVRLGGISGAVIGTLVFTTNDAWHLEAFVQNRNSASAQRAQAWGRREGDTVVKAWSNGVTAAVDTTAAVDLVITSQKATAGDAFTLESRLVELLP